jgi:hypothetical protein
VCHGGSTQAVKRANIGEPVLNAAALAKSIPGKTKAGISDVKRARKYAF